MLPANTQLEEAKGIVMANNGQRGRFVWHELMTPNRAGAQDFYSNSLGWRIEPWAHDPSYSMFAGPSGPLGGSVEQPPNAVPQWVPYISVPDVEETLRQATELGASVTIEPTKIDNGGRYAVLTDPQGATFGIYSAAEHGPETDAGPGEFSWHELATADYRAAFDFYQTLFGWENVTEHDMGPMGIYLIFGRNGKQVGGIFNKGESGKPGPAYWVSYVRVQDVSRTVEKVKAGHGSLAAGPMEVPGGDWIAQLFDPYGAMFAVHAMAEDVKSAERPGQETMITEVWTATEPAASKEPSKKKASKKKASKKKASKKAGKSKAATAKPAKQKASKTKAARGATAKKKPGAKKSAAKKAGGKKPGKKKAAKKKTAKTKASKKTTKKAAKKKTGKSSKKKAAKKTVRAKSRGKKAAKKNVGKKKTGKKKAAKRKR